MLIKLVVRYKRVFVKSINDYLFKRCYKVCFDKIVLIFIVLFIIIFRRNLINEFIKIFRRRILIKSVFIMLIVFLIIQRRIFLIFDMINFSNVNKELFERIFVEVFKTLIIS